MSMEDYYEERDRETVERIRREARREAVEAAVIAPFAVVVAAVFIFSLVLLGV